MLIKTPEKKINEKKKKKKGKLEPQKYVYLRNTFIRGPPYNAYKNTRKNKLNEINKDNNKKKKGKIEPQKYVYLGSPL